MSLLYKHLRIHQIFGANTDVGKTILTSALVRASTTHNVPVHYLKPVSTGPMQDADDEHVKRFGGAFNSLINQYCLFRYGEPVSPHLAATLALEDGTPPPPTPSDETFLQAVSNYIQRCASSTPNNSLARMYVETAGGVHSPMLSGTTQVDGYRPLYLPTVLIGDSKLGGISSTISSYEALTMRGYAIDALLVFKDDYYRNWEFLTPYFAERGLSVFSIDAPPPKLENDSDNFKSTEDYYQAIVPEDKTSPIFDAVKHLDDRHISRLKELESMPRRALDTIWWPFVQHGMVRGEKDVTVIDSASSDFFSIYRPQETPSSPEKYSLLAPQFDGSASWWTQTVGHSHPRLALAAARAAGRYGHVMFPQAAHAPALKLSERLVHDGPGRGWASRAFISDNGSTGMEIAIKMALRAYTTRHGSSLDASSKRRLGILGLKGSYHGDTIGAMDACDAGEGVYTCEWHDAKGFWFDPPSVSIRDGKVIITLPPALASEDGADVTLDSWQAAYDVPSRLETSLAQRYRDYIQRTLDSLRKSGGPELAALVIEPLVLGAGGMIFVDPLFQRVLIDAVRGSAPGDGTWTGLPVIFDEVFVGLHRLGLESSGPLLGANPDISVHAKALTGGLIPLAVTLANESIFKAFLSENKADALLHGHSYSAHAIGCEVANETLDMMTQMKESESWLLAQDAWQKDDGSKPIVWSFWDPEFIKVLSTLPQVTEVKTMGTVLAFKTADEGGYRSGSAQQLLQALKTITPNASASSAPGGAPYNVHYRTLGNVAYFMLSLNTSPTVVRELEEKIWRAVAGA